ALARRALRLAGLAAPVAAAAGSAGGTRRTRCRQRTGRPARAWTAAASVAGGVRRVASRAGRGAAGRGDLAGARKRRRCGRGPGGGLRTDAETHHEAERRSRVSERLERLKEITARARTEVGKVVIGQEAVVDAALITIFAGQHALV